MFWTPALADPVAAAGDSGQAAKLLVLPFDMVDSSLQGEMNHGPLPADVARLRRTEKVIHRALDESSEFALISNTGVGKQIDAAQGSYRYLYACNGCEIDLGKSAGADLVMTGWVQKVSNLIININATLYDVSKAKPVGGASVDMRGNTDEAWRSAARYLIEHSLLSNYRSRQAAAKDGAG
ncbi:hypothetical protein SADO_13113 [Salinisphaera dokdonensis CL-ES53]|uniref:DUF2380 domain-containing protein n=1 Tax=Salinisphaera dokdonensis CL-ES53 TaxID=1304272 RepID=A0ABV2B2T0_9GAMM